MLISHRGGGRPQHTGEGIPGTPGSRPGRGPPHPRTGLGPPPPACLMASGEPSAASEPPPLVSRGVLRLRWATRWPALPTRPREAAPAATAPARGHSRRTFAFTCPASRAMMTNAKTALGDLRCAGARMCVVCVHMCVRKCTCVRECVRVCAGECVYRCTYYVCVHRRRGAWGQVHVCVCTQLHIYVLCVCAQVLSVCACIGACECVHVCARMCR